ncbi:aminoadipate-semialdehyde dehydrogenase [Lycorma delicatula]|uniref:aminoadipate-semialdehyde dehydrogenase n=1 Tax=Lycorma delicatula TaxID=130591 RepID=UPI003F519F51
MSKCPFVCIGVNCSSEQLQNLITTIRVSFIITERKYSKVLNNLSKEFNYLKSCELMDEVIEIWCIGIHKELINVNTDRPQQFFYAIQTSGSTGVPKIVQVPEKCILPNVYVLSKLFGITPSDVIYFSSPVTFDPSVIELFLALTTGATIFIIKRELKAAAYNVLDILFPDKKTQRRVHNITFIQTTPSLFLNWPVDFVRKRVMNDDTTLKVLALGGECCPSWEVIKSFSSEHNNTKIFSLYGITEVSCWASIHQIKPGDDGSNLGQPLTETILQVKGEDGEQISNGVGEMFIGSSTRYCLLDGEVLENLQFPVFRSTGDIVKVSNNEYHYLGRKDSIIKRWGHRVCLLQIEKFTLACDYVKCCTCMLDEKYGLVLLVVLCESNRDHLIGIRSYLKNILNPASIPDHILCIDDIPLNNHGKVNYTLLKSVLKKEFDLLRINKHQSSDISKEDIELIFKEVWVKNTSVNLISFEKGFSHVLYENDSLPSSSSSSSINFQQFKYDVGFLSSGGNSVSAIQLVSELSQFVRVPSIFIGKLLENSTFQNCYKLLIENCFEKDPINDNSYTDTFILNKDQNEKNNIITPVIITEDIGTTKSEKLSNSTFIEEKCDEEILISCAKKQKLGDSVDDSSVVSIRCRGKSFVSYPTEESNFLNIKQVNLKVKWKYDLRKCVDASPTLVSYKSGKQLVLVGSHSGDMAVIKLQDGEVISLSNLPDRIESSALISECGRYYYVGCYDKNLYCVDINSGDIIWSFATSGMVKSSPVKTSNSHIVFGSYDHNLYCLCSKTGSQVWCYKGSASFSSVPCVTDSRKIITASLDGTCIALTSDTATLLWSYKLSSPVFASPVIFGHNVIFAQVTGTLYCFNINSGKLCWKLNVDGNIFSSLTLCERNNESVIVFGCHDHYVYCLSTNSEPKVIWKTCFESSIFSTPFVYGKNKKLIAVCTTKGIINILDLNDGSILSSHIMPGEIFSSPVIEGNNIVFGCRDNYVYCLQIY